MAIFSLNVSVTQRSKGQSAIASVAYILGEKFIDERTGETHSYKSRHDIIDLGTQLPNNKQIETEALWNLAEAAESRINSRTARKIIVALPVETTKNENLEILNDFRQFLSKQYNVPTTVAIHYDKAHNPHAHVIITTREWENGQFTKKTRALDDKKNGPEQIEKIREEWATIVNKRLQQHSISIDHRSYQKQGIKKLPTIHLGPKVAAMAKKGIVTQRLIEYQKIKEIQNGVRKYNEDFYKFKAKRKQAREQRAAKKRAQKTDTNNSRRRDIITATEYNTTDKQFNSEQNSRFQSTADIARKRQRTSNGNIESNKQQFKRNTKTNTTINAGGRTERKQRVSRDSSTDRRDSSTDRRNLGLEQRLERLCNKTLAATTELKEISEQLKTKNDIKTIKKVKHEYEQLKHTNKKSRFIVEHEKQLATDSGVSFRSRSEKARTTQSEIATRPSPF